MAIKNTGDKDIEIKFGFEPEQGPLILGVPAKAPKGEYWGMLMIVAPPELKGGIDKRLVRQVDPIKVPVGTEVFVKVPTETDNRRLSKCKLQAFIFEEQRVVARSKLGDEPNKSGIPDIRGAMDQTTQPSN